MSRRLPSLLASLSCLALLPVSAHAELEIREATLAILEKLPAKDSGIDLRARVNDGAEKGVRVGDEIQYHFETAKDAYLTVVHLDSHGVATLLFPAPATGDNRLRAGVPRDFPSAEDGFKIEVEPPLGLEDLVAVATLEPIDPAALGIQFDEGEAVKVLDAPAANKFAEKLDALLRKRPQNEIAFAHVSQRVSGRSEGIELRSEDIVALFTTRTRAIRRPRLNLHIRFETGSAVLDSEAKAQLDEVGRALGDRRLADARFVVGGHTDDIGDADFNLQLSESRAEAVRKYLSAKHGVARERLNVAAFGESKPLEANTSDAARFANRRVEFVLDR